MKTIIKNFTVITITIIFVSAYFIVGLLLYSSALYNRVNISNLENSLLTIGRLTPASVFSGTGETEAWSSLFDQNETSYRVTLISRNGRVLFDTNAESAAMEDHLARPEFQEAIMGGLGIHRRRSATLGQEYIYAAMGIKDSESKIIGVLRLSRPVPSFSSRLLGSAFPFLLGGIVLLIVSSVGLYRFLRGLSRSLEVRQAAELEEKTRELKKQTEDAEGEGERLQAILNSMSEGIVALDSSLKVILVNHRLCAFFGFKNGQGSDNLQNSGDEILGMSLLEFSRSVELEEKARQVLASGVPLEFTIKRYTAGFEQHFRVYATPMNLKSNRGLLVVLGDISRLVKLEQVRKDFVANVSHELRTPIQVVKGFAENILDSSRASGDAPDNLKQENIEQDKIEQIRRFAEIIVKNAGTMENLANDLLTLASLEDKESPRLLMEETLLAPLIGEAAQMVEIAAKKKNSVIEISCPDDLSVCLHGPFIIQALVNLLDNAIKYSGVPVSGRQPDASLIKVNAFTLGEQLFIEVKDNGIGIPAEHLGRIFERFYRVDRSRSREAGGTGLGLAIVRHIALLHHGSVEVESHSGEGSLFRMILPAKYVPKV